MRILNSLFSNSLTLATFILTTTTARNSIMSWEEIERQFYTQFSKDEPEVCIAKFSSVTQRSRVTMNLFIAINLVDPLHHKVAVGDPPSTRSFTSPLPVEKTHDLRKKSQASNA